MRELHQQNTVLLMNFVHKLHRSITCSSFHDGKLTSFWLDH
jgi:hypothetical protein